MAKKKTDEEVNLLRRALKVAAVEAYQTEIIASQMHEHLIGGDKEYSSEKEWIDHRIDNWLEEAELKR